VRAVNLQNGLAFSFQANSGNTVGSFQVGTTGAVNPNAAPFTTNASGMVTNLNANLLGGLTASQIESQAVSTANTAAQALSSIAAVSAGGALQKARGATAASLSSTGNYLVTFGSSIANCVYQATITSGTPGIVTTTEASSTVVSVSTFNPTGTTPTSLPFQLTVNC
jgi:hypothetical protein